MSIWISSYSYRYVLASLFLSSVFCIRILGCYAAFTALKQMLKKLLLFFCCSLWVMLLLVFNFDSFYYISNCYVCSCFISAVYFFVLVLYSHYENVIYLILILDLNCLILVAWMFLIFANMSFRNYEFSLLNLVFSYLFFSNNALFHFF